MYEQKTHSEMICNLRCSHYSWNTTICSLVYALAHGCNSICTCTCNHVLVTFTKHLGPLNEQMLVIKLFPLICSFIVHICNMQYYIYVCFCCIDLGMSFFSTVIQLAHKDGKTNIDVMCVFLCMCRWSAS